MLYISFPWLIYFVTESLYFLISFTYFFLPFLTLWQPPVQRSVYLWLCFCFVCSLVYFFFQIPHEWNHTIFILWFISLSIIPFRFIYVVTNGKILFFYVLVWTEKTGELQYMGSQRVGRDWATNTDSVFCVFLLEHSVHLHLK